MRTTEFRIFPSPQARKNTEPEDHDLFHIVDLEGIGQTVELWRGPDHCVAERSTINAISSHSIEVHHAKALAWIINIGLSSCRSLSEMTRKSMGFHIAEI
jgi:hypothetical protein